MAALPRVVAVDGARRRTIDLADAWTSLLAKQLEWFRKNRHPSADPGANFVGIMPLVPRRRRAGAGCSGGRATSVRRDRRSETAVEYGTARARERHRDVLESQDAPVVVVVVSAELSRCLAPPWLSTRSAGGRVLSDGAILLQGRSEKSSICWSPPPPSPGGRPRQSGPGRRRAVETRKTRGRE